VIGLARRLSPIFFRCLSIRFGQDLLANFVADNPATPEYTDLAVESWSWHYLTTTIAEESVCRQCPVSGAKPQGHMVGATDPIGCLGCNRSILHHRTLTAHDAW